MSPCHVLGSVLFHFQAHHVLFGLKTFEWPNPLWYGVSSPLNVFITMFCCRCVNGKSILFMCAIFVLCGLMLSYSSSSTLSNMFNVYAADNCDATSTCANVD